MRLLSKDTSRFKEVKVEHEAMKTPMKKPDEQEQSLEYLYKQYFSAPPKNQPDDLREVSLFDYSVATHTSDSTIEIKEMKTA